MNELNLLDLFSDDLFSDEVVQAHDLMDSEREPYVEDYDDGMRLGRVIVSPFRPEPPTFTS